MKGLTTLSADKIGKRIEKANSQVQADNSKYSSYTNRQGKVILISKHGSDVSKNTIIAKMKEGLRKAQKNGPIKAKVEVWIGDQRIELN